MIACVIRIVVSFVPSCICIRSLITPHRTMPLCEFFSNCALACLSQQTLSVRSCVKSPKARQAFVDFSPNLAALFKIQKRPSYSVQTGHHLVLWQRGEVVDIETLGGQGSLHVGWDQAVVEMWSNGEFYVC